ncbi:MAG: Gfo/Idh/MocA family oxidoreductase [Verrucomicrobia bacterium]|nr:Gfo/Idh/MocA family oxidoreductase [Verrucomicrobiota bacterium]
MNHLTRRTFLKSSAFAGAAVAFSARSWAQVAGANGDVRVAVIGLNGRGKNHLGSLAKVKGVRVVALCDPDSAVLERTKKNVGGDVKGYTDIRELLAAKDIDAVTIATPNHWHSLAAIWACQNGKDVYVEKPVSHNVWEGRQLVAAAAKHNRIVQAGTQIRSGEGLREAVAWVRAGNLGKITAARGFCYKFRGSIGKVDAPPAPPASVNLDLWCGPAPKVVPHRRKFHYDWHWDYVTGNGDVGNQGIHQMDVARWFLGASGLPRHTVSVGGRLGYVDDGNTPNTQVVLHDYATAPLIFEVRGLPAGKPAATPTVVANAGDGEEGGGRAAMDKYKGVSVGNVIDCEGGYVVTASYFSATAYDKAGKVVKEFKGSDRHMQNFIDCVRSRKAAELYGPIEEGHVSSALCHLGNISHVLGRGLDPDELKQAVKGNAPLGEAYGRMVEHLTGNRVDLAKTRLAFGAALTLEAGKERFVSEFADAANRLLSRSYRAPFVVPQLA